MLSILICDDIRSHLVYIKNIIEKFILIEELDMKVVCAATEPMEILECVKQQKQAGLYFLDVELKGELDGFQLAEKIRKYDPRGFIVFITTHEEMSYLAFRYKVEAMDYILKERTEEIPQRILECLRKVQERLSSPQNLIHKVLCVNEGERKILVNQQDVYCIKTCGTSHKIRIYTENSFYEFTNSLKEIKDKLDSNFLQIHKSCIVNWEKVNSFDKKEKALYLKNGQKCSVAARKVSMIAKQEKTKNS